MNSKWIDYLLAFASCAAFFYISDVIFSPHIFALLVFFRIGQPPAPPPGSCEIRGGLHVQSHLQELSVSSFSCSARE